MKLDVKDDLIKNRVTQLIKEKNITPYKVAINSGMNPSTLNNILSGKFKDIRISTITKICCGLNITMKDFFDDDSFIN